MTDLIDYKRLASIEGEKLISFFIPTHRAEHADKDIIRYKNQIQATEQSLLRIGMEEAYVKKRLRVVKEKLEDSEFWKHQSDGLAVFIHKETEFFTLPIDFESNHYIGDRLYLKPILPLLSGDYPFFLLALSQNQVTLYQGSRYEIAELEPSTLLPKSLEKFAEVSIGQPTLQAHSGSGNSIFHGQGKGEEEDDARLLEYLQQIDKGMMDLMCTDDIAPLLLAGDATLISRYRQVNSYPYLHENFLSGNFDDADPLMLHERAWEIMRSEVQKRYETLKDQFELSLVYEKGSFLLQDIFPAAVAGRVELLFLEEEYEVWGTYDNQSHQIEIHPTRQSNSIPLLEEAARATLAQGGQVISRPRQDLPRPVANANAIFRYAVHSN